MSIPNSFDPLGSQLLPAGYKRVNYLESTGTQWIDTGLTEVNDWEIDMKFRIVSVASEGAESYYCRHYGSLIGGRGLSGLLYNGNGWSFWGSESAYINVNAAGFLRRDINWNVNADRGLIDGKLYYYNNTPLRNFRLEGSLYLFARRINNGAQIIQGTVFRVYYFKINALGEQALHFIPALDPQNRPCMFDLVTKTPFYNQGSGEFLYG